MKILFSTPVAYDGNDARYLARDAARMIQALKVMGHTGVKVVLADERNLPGPFSPDLMKATFREWCSADFWRAQAADGMLLYGGFSKRMFPVARAARESGLKVFLKEDTAFGPISFPSYAACVFAKKYWFFRMRHGCFRSSLLASATFAKWTIFSQNAFFRRYFSLFDKVTAETPLGADETRKAFHRCGLADNSPVETLPHPVPDSFCQPIDFSTKKPILLAVAADWANPLKRGRLLVDALQRVLPNHPQWKVLVIGRNSERLKRRFATSGLEFSAEPLLRPEELIPIYRRARILAMPSGSEGSPNVVAEALCCGCSVVFTPNLPQLCFAVDAGCGRMSASSSVAKYASALDLEMRRWDVGEAPDKTAQWHDFFAASSVTRKLLDWVEGK